MSEISCNLGNSFSKEIFFSVTFVTCKCAQGHNTEEVEEMEVDKEPTAVVKGKIKIIMLQRLCKALNLKSRKMEKIIEILV